MPTLAACRYISDPSGLRVSHVTDAIRSGGSSVRTIWSVHWFIDMARRGLRVPAGAAGTLTLQPPSSMSAIRAGRTPHQKRTFTPP
jgi:hypothetical protein